MQDIVFYVAANKTLGIVRDYSNSNNSFSPDLTLGAAVCLRMRLFATASVATPYPVASFSGIVDWQWYMDSDFDRSTTCKLIADEGGISVHTVTDTIDGQTKDFTEFEIPISNMNTEELAEWLGNESAKSGLTGELVGRDSSGNDAFVLQIENFTVRNRVGGLAEPTALDEGIVTRPVAEQMIQTAVSASAATKQDKLTSANAGIGISISSTGTISTSDVPQSAVSGLSSSLAAKQDKLTSANAGAGISISGTGTISMSDVPQSAVSGLSSSLAAKQDKLTAGTGISISSTGIISTSDVPQSAVSGLSSSLAGKQDKLTSANAGTGITISSTGTISTSDVPQSAVSGLSSSLAAKQDKLTAGYRMAVVSGSTVDQTRYFGIEPSIIAPANQTTNVVLCAGKAYEIHAVATNAKVLLTREEPPSARTFGLEGHAEIFVANNSYVQTGANVVLANALEPDAVNNCTVRFHDGLAIISVEDHVAGYIVTAAGGTASGSLYYGLATATNEYISVDASLNGQTLDLAGVTTRAGEKHVVGNGYSETVISGGVTCTSKTTFSNLSMDGVIVSSGTMTLGDAKIPSGSTVAVSGGGLAIERVTVEGTLKGAGVGTLSFTHGANVNGNGIINIGGSRCLFGYGAMISGCSVTGGVNDPVGNPRVAGGALLCSGGTANLIECEIFGNTAAFGGGIMVDAGAFASVRDCNFHDNTGDDIGVCGSARVEGCAMNRIGLYNGNVILAGSNTISFYCGMITAGSPNNTVLIESGTTLNLTGNTNATPIAPGGGITIGSNVQILTTSGSSTKVTEISGGTYAKIANGQVDSTSNPRGNVLLGPVTIGNGESIVGGTNAIIDLVGTNVNVTHASLSNIAVSGGSAAWGGGFILWGSDTTLNMTNCKITNCVASNGGAVYCEGSLVLNGCEITGNSATTPNYYGGGGLKAKNALVSNSIISGNQGNGKDIQIIKGGTVTVIGSTVGEIKGERVDSSATMSCVLSGENTIGAIIPADYGSGVVGVTLTSGATLGLISILAPGGAIDISSDATLDLQNNTTHTPIYTSAGITFGANVKVIHPGGTSSFLNYGSAGTCNAITSDGSIS